MGSRFNFKSHSHHLKPKRPTRDKRPQHLSASAETLSRSEATAAAEQEGFRAAAGQNNSFYVENPNTYSDISV